MCTHTLRKYLTLYAYMDIHTCIHTFACTYICTCLYKQLKRERGTKDVWVKSLYYQLATALLYSAFHDYLSDDLSIYLSQFFHILLVIFSTMKLSTSPHTRSTAILSQTKHCLHINKDYLQWNHLGASVAM